MKLNIFTGLLLAVLFTMGVNTNAGAHGWGCCRWHHHHCCGAHQGCGGHMCTKDKEKDNDGDKDEKKECEKGKSCCNHGCGWGTCHSWEYVAPKHAEKCCHKDGDKHECHHK